MFLSRRGVVVLFFFFFFFFESLLKVSSLPPGNGHNFQSYKSRPPEFTSHTVVRRGGGGGKKKEKTFVGRRRRRPARLSLSLCPSLLRKTRGLHNDTPPPRQGGICRGLVSPSLGVNCGVFRREYYYSKREKLSKKSMLLLCFTSLIFRVSQKETKP